MTELLRCKATAGRRRRAVLLAVSSLALLLGYSATSPGSASSATGYELDAVQQPIPIEGNRVVAGMTVDDANQRPYFAIATLNIDTGLPGEIEQRESTGTATAASPFTTGLSNSYFSGVAVDPKTQNIFAAQVRVTLPNGTFGEHRVRLYTPTGSQITSFPVTNTTLYGSQIATDSNGRLFYTNDASNSVEVFNSSGALQMSITCGGACPGGELVSPVSVALDSADNVYVADRGTDRILKFALVEGSYKYSTVIQSGRQARMLAVNRATDDIFVGSDDGQSGYHIIAYDSSGTQFDDFGADVFGEIPDKYAHFASPAIAPNRANSKLYIGDPANSRVLIFDRVTISPPSAVTEGATAVGQVTATLDGTVNANRHAVTACHFEYTTEPAFQANGFEGAMEQPCGMKPDGRKDTPVSGGLSGLSSETTYRYRLVAENDAGATKGDTLTFTTLPAVAPSVAAEPVTSLGQNTATLAASVNPHGGVVSDCHFEYGKTTSYGSEVPCSTTPGPATTSLPQRAGVSGLSGGTTYHYRLVVTTNAGVGTSSDAQFTTLAAAAPTVISQPPAAVTQTSGAITGTVNPNGSPTTCWFEFGASPAYGTTAPCPVDPGDGTSAVLQQLNFTGLAPGTTYHYRIGGTNAAGTAYGADVAFTTQLVPPPPVTQPPPPTTTPPPTTQPSQPRRCKRGFRKKRVRGKVRCVRKRARKRCVKRKKVRGKRKCVKWKRGKVKRRQKRSRRTKRRSRRMANASQAAAWQSRRSEAARSGG